MVTSIAHTPVAEATSRAPRTHRCSQPAGQPVSEDVMPIRPNYRASNKPRIQDFNPQILRRHSPPYSRACSVAPQTGFRVIGVSV
jgi:hypothetical protein